MPASAKDRQGMMIIGLGAAALVAVGIFAQLNKPPERDQETGCTASVPSATVILLDHSEGMPEQTQREIEKRVVDFVTNKTPTESRISMYAVSDSSSQALI